MNDLAVDERLRRLLGAPSLVGLRKRLRQRYQGVPAGQAPREFRINTLTPDERAALAALQGQRPGDAASIRVNVAVIDATLSGAGVAASLRDALERLDGRIVDRAAERMAVHAQWREVFAGCTQPLLAALVGSSAGAGLVKRVAGQSPSLAATLLDQARTVLEVLPGRGMTRSGLAASTLGDAHALDNGRPVATLVLAALRQASPLDADAIDAPLDEEDERRGASGRDLWAAAGVLVNELARPALFLNLPRAGSATARGDAAGAGPAPGDAAGGGPARGEPGYLSLRSLLRAPPRWAVAGRDVFVCENPNLLAIAAERLGARCAPLVCTDGMPAAAQRALLTQLAQAGARLRYHGDFDWPGLRIGNHVMRAYGAVPWRFGAADYLEATRGALAPAAGRRLKGPPVAAEWDADLAPAMQACQQAVDEELVADRLLESLASPEPPATDLSCSPPTGPGSPGSPASTCPA